MRGGRASLAAAVLLGSVAATLAAVVAGQEASVSVWDGVYTDSQAARGRELYAAHCTVCHGATLGGVGEAPALTGPRFVSDFDGLTLGAVFERIRTTMPLDAPAGLQRAEYCDILAFVLQINGFPSGPNELYRRTEYLEAIAFEARRHAP